VEAAGRAIQQVNSSQVTVIGQQEGHMVVKLATPGKGLHPGTRAPAAAGSDAHQVYHIWPVHGFVFDAGQYSQLLEATEADRQLHQHAQLLQALDAAWLVALGKQRGYISRLRELVADIEQCGFAGLEHLQEH
jgi:hypothetical protein